MSTPASKIQRKAKRAPLLNPAELVTARFGGVRPLARLLNQYYDEIGYGKIDHSAVAYWRRSKYGGRIPSERIPHLQALAKRERVRLTSDELLNGGRA